ncbi:MAG: hypothetical protein ACI9O4_001424 [Chitinophagales bacterium]|jgi:hypothetical protein
MPIQISVGIKIKAADVSTPRFTLKPEVTGLKYKAIIGIIIIQQAAANSSRK